MSTKLLNDKGMDAGLTRICGRRSKDLSLSSPCLLSPLWQFKFYIGNVGELLEMFDLDFNFLVICFSSKIFKKASPLKSFCSASLWLLSQHLHRWGLPNSQCFAQLCSEYTKSSVRILGWFHMWSDLKCRWIIRRCGGLKTLKRMKVPTVTKE